MEPALCQLYRRTFVPYSIYCASIASRCKKAEPIGVPFGVRLGWNQETVGAGSPKRRANFGGDISAHFNIIGNIWRAVDLFSTLFGTRLQRC